MKIFTYCSFILIAFYFLSCSPSSEPRFERFDTEACGKWDDTDPLTIDELEPANSRTASNYIISGKCDKNNAEIHIYVEGMQLNEFPRCRGGKWQTSLNLTGVIFQRRDYQIALSAGGRGGRLCSPDTINNFYCPNEGYIGVAKLEGFTDRDFCVMKYEARTNERGSSNRNDSRQQGRVVRAESTINGAPITRVTETEAIRYCKENGPGYDLINNNEWQTIARSIEVVDKNWERNRSTIESGNRLNIGSTVGIRISSDDREEENDNWGYDKRFHELSNGAKIWDFAGHLWEIVKMNTVPSNVEKYNGFVYEMPFGLKRLFGPQRDYSILKGSTHQEGRNGLGRLYIDSFRGSLIRGGANQQNSGIFSADTTKDNNGVVRQNIGFRCVYYP